MVMETDVFTKSLRMVVSSNLMRLRENSGFFLDVNSKHREEKSFLLYDLKCAHNFSFCILCKST